MRQILGERAKKGLTIPYTDLVADIKAINLPRNSPAFWDMLGEISEAEDAAGRGMLSVIVVHKVGDMQPGTGFFQLAKKLKRDTSDILVCWIDELKRVHGHWCTVSSQHADS
jgi:hypothetical protein